MKIARAKNPPERIYLNVGDLDEDCEFSDLSAEDITWCDDSIFPADIEYRLVKRRKRSQTDAGAKHG